MGRLVQSSSIARTDRSCATSGVRGSVLSAKSESGYGGLTQTRSSPGIPGGSKNDFLGHRVRLDSSVYYINWKSIQQNIALPCGFQFVSNLGGATSKGFDIQGDFVVTDNLLLDVTVGYTNAAFTQTVKAGPAATTNLASDGDHLVGWPWTGTVSGIYNFKAMGQDA